MATDFCETTGSLARKAGVGHDTIRVYEGLGLLECQRLPNGTRMFRRGAEKLVKRILAQRLANRGGNHRGSPKAA
jgi:DNA-binding transcriptional MerR regulator